jgi:hypothetical protein
MQLMLFGEVSMYVHLVFVRDVCYRSMQFMMFSEVSKCTRLVFVLRSRHRLCGLTNRGVEMCPVSVCSSVTCHMAWRRWRVDMPFEWGMFCCELYVLTMGYVGLCLEVGY